MIYDFEQPVKAWMADNIKNFGILLAVGDDPSFIIELHGAEIEIRLNKLPGFFERKTVKIESN